MSRNTRRLWAAGLLFTCFGILASHAAEAAEKAFDPAGEAAERRRLLAQHHEIEARHVARERECAERFAVTVCLDESHAQRRGALADVKAQLVALDGRQRARRAAARQRRIDAKVARRAQALEGAASMPLLPRVLPLNATR